FLRAPGQPSSGPPEFKRGMDGLNGALPVPLVDDERYVLLGRSLGDHPDIDAPGCDRPEDPRSDPVSAPHPGTNYGDHADIFLRSDVLESPRPQQGDLQGVDCLSDRRSAHDDAYVGL